MQLGTMGMAIMVNSYGTELEKLGCIGCLHFTLFAVWECGFCLARSVVYFMIMFGGKTSFRFFSFFFHS